nr:hypothetical protein [Tanacetum cinerariifolium]
MDRDTIQLETVVSTISQEYLLEFTSEYGISEDLHPEFPGPEERIADFPEAYAGKYDSRVDSPTRRKVGEIELKLGTRFEVRKKEWNWEFTNEI